MLNERFPGSNITKISAKTSKVLFEKVLDRIERNSRRSQHLFLSDAHKYS